MPPPSQISIATSSVQRLIKEEASYHKELESQLTRLQALETNPAAGDENADFQLKQERQAIAETRAVFPSLRQRIADAVQRLEDQLEAGQGSGDSAMVLAEIGKAKEVIEGARKAILGVNGK